MNWKSLGKHWHARPRRQGLVTIWVVLLLLILIGFVGLASDAAFITLVNQQLQNTADASALAGALHVRNNQAQARQAAIDLALANPAARTPVQLDRNEANDPSGDVVLGRWDRDTKVFTPTTVGPNAVRVLARRTAGSPDGPVGLIFGPIFGVTNADLARDAIATLGGGTGAGLIVLNEEAKDALLVQGDSIVRVNEIDPDTGALLGGGAVQINSNHATQALYVRGSKALIDAATVNVVGDGVNVKEDSLGVTYECELNLGADTVDDPLGDLPPPPIPATDQGEVKHTTGSLNLTPGYYSGGITASGGSVHLDPGIYILDGAGLNISGNTTFIAEGVMFYITGTGVVDIGGSGTIRVTSPDLDAYTYPTEDQATIALYEGVTIFQDRNNTNDARIIGTSLLDLDGTLYFPENHVILSGTGDGFGSQLIADTMDVQGTGDITINYDGRFPAPGNRVFLVQ